jgi:hypothetical protein
MRNLVGSATFGLMPIPMTPVGDRPAGIANHLEAPTPSHPDVAALPDRPFNPRPWADGQIPQALALALGLAPNAAEHDGRGVGWANLSWLRHIRRWSQAPLHQ